MIIEGILEQLSEVKELSVIVTVLLLLYYVALTVAQWHLFKKAGEKSWKALIPVYSLFVSHHIIGMSHIWFILDIIFWAAEIALEMFKVTPLWIEDVFFSVAIIFTIVSEIIHIMKLCYCYTKSERFGIGFFILPPLFSLILAFDKSEYHPPRSHRKHKSTH